MKKFLSALLCVVLLLQAFPAPVVGDGGLMMAPEVSRPQNYEACTSEKALGALVDIEELKQVLLNAILNCSDEADLSSFHIPNNALYGEALLDLIFYEMAESFHVTSFARWYDDFGYVTKLTFNYSVTADTYQVMHDRLVAAKEKLLKGIKGNPLLTDVEKALLIHDRLAAVCEYDYNCTEHRYDCYGALVEGTAVCQGYTEAYDYLLEEVGIESYLCSSDALNHVWNIVFVDGVPYHVDVTWDDYAWDSGDHGVAGVMKHDNFLRSSAGIYETGHRASDYDVHPSDTRYDNGFWQCSNTAFQLVGDELYYIDNDAQQLIRSHDGKVICSVADTWDCSVGYWSNQSCLCSDGKVLYYSLANAVYSYDPATGTTAKVYEPQLPRYYHIYGLNYEDGKLICGISDAPPYATSYRTEWYQLEYELPKTLLLGDVNGDGEVTTRDRTILTRYLAGWKGYKINPEAADLNSDGSVDTRDRAILYRHLAKWDGYKTLPYTN